MKFVRCPRCELNYITAVEKYCKVCLREMKGDGAQDEIEMCSVCSENPALPGRDICLFCLKEMNANNDRGDDDNDTRVDETSLGIDPVSSMDEIIPEIDEDIPEREYDEIESDLSLDELGEEEAEDDEDEDD